MRVDTFSREKRYVVNAMMLTADQRPDFVATTCGDIEVLSLDTASHRYMTIAADGVWCAENRGFYAAYSDAAIFQQLADQWRIERGASSSITQIAMCRSYQRIIAMGAAVAVPLIFGELRRNEDDPDHWFWALQMLTGIDPVPSEAQGDMRLMARAWLAWGRWSGYAC